MATSSPCNILAIVLEISVFNLEVVRAGKIREGDWVRLTHCQRDHSYRTDIEGTWGTLGRQYRPIINLETGELL